MNKNRTIAFKSLLTPDFCVIGGGAGGLSFAAGAAQMGASVVLAEANKMGGDCLNAGCVPSKALIAAAQFADHWRRSRQFGWQSERPVLDFARVREHIQSVIDAIAPNDSIERFEALGVKVVLERASFIDPETVETLSFKIKAKHFIIATGSTPFLPPIEGLAETPYLTNESIFNLTELPPHLAVIGGGPIGVEIAQAFLRLGSRVTVLESASVLPKDDPEMVARLKQIIVQEGVVLHENITIESVSQSNNQIQLNFHNAAGEGVTLMASHVVVAAGRRPNIQALNLSLASVRHGPRGIEVDASLRTSNKKIFAIGDCVGGFQFTHMAGYHAGLAIRNAIFGFKFKVGTKAIPWVTYTDPELTHVGLTEPQLKNQKIAYKVFWLDFDENDRAQAERRTEGAIKVLVSRSGRVLGVTILGVHAGELIYPWVIAIQNNLKLSAIVGSVVPYPTLSDISKKIAGQFYAEKVFSSWMKKIVQFIMRWFH